jgi:hypothetical protein
MANGYEITEDEELHESDDEAEDEEAEDEEAEDEESAVAMFRPFPGTLPNPVPLGMGPSSALAMQLRQRARERRLKGVRAALIRGKDGATAVVRLPTAVATARGVQLLSRRSAYTEAALAQQQRTLRRTETTARNTITGAILVQHARDVANEARRTVAQIGAAAAAWEPYLAGLDYALSAAQTGFAVAAIPPSRRSLIFSTLPVTGTAVSSLLRETLRSPLGLARGVAAKPLWPDVTLAVGVPTLVGAVISYLVYPGRRRRYMAV